MKSALRILIRQFTSPAILILTSTAIIYGLLGNTHDALVLLAIIIPSGLLTFIQEFRADTTLKALSRRLERRFSIYRNGDLIEVEANRIEVGDEIELQPGDFIPADMSIISSENLAVDESNLTGEAFPRRIGGSAGEELLMGTFIVSGSCRARTRRIGSETEFGKMQSKMTEIDIETSFERGIRDFGSLVARAIFILVIFVFMGNIALDRPFFNSLLFSLALAVGLTPQMLPVIISVCLSAGARHLAAEKVLVRRLDAIEDFGTLDVLCVDKTGTLTSGELRVSNAIDTRGNVSHRVERLAYTNALLQKSSSNFIDTAIRKLDLKVDVPKKIKENDYSFERRVVSVLTDTGELITKGAFKEVLEKCSYVRVGDQIKSKAEYSVQLKKLHNSKVEAGYKIIAVASKAGDVERDLTFEGFVLIEDAAKPDARAALEELSKLGVEIVLITGDSAVSALHVARLCGMDASTHITGEELETLSEQELKERALRCRIFAEINPRQKSRIVSSFKAEGRTVGFLGDGINDALALKSSDVSIGVEHAVDVAKSASSIVLLEKDLSVIADGVRLGRRTFENTMKYIRITISASFGNVLSMAIASLFLPFLPMLPTQILLLNFLSDLPAVAISSDRVDEEDLQRPAHWTMRGIGHFMVFFGMISTFFDISLFLISTSILDGTPGDLRSSWFATSLITEVTAILVLRTRRISWKSRPSKTLFLLSILVVLVAWLVPIYGLLGNFGLPKVGVLYLVAILLLTFGFAIALEISKLRAKLMRKVVLWV